VVVGREGDGTFGGSVGRNESGEGFGLVEDFPEVLPFTRKGLVFDGDFGIEDDLVCDGRVEPRNVGFSVGFDFGRGTAPLEAVCVCRDVDVSLLAAADGHGNEDDACDGVVAFDESS
jgi:hypothetical protein